MEHGPATPLLPAGGVHLTCLADEAIKVVRINKILIITVSEFNTPVRSHW